MFSVEAFDAVAIIDMPTRVLLQGEDGGMSCRLCASLEALGPWQRRDAFAEKFFKGDMEMLVLGIQCGCVMHHPDTTSLVAFSDDGADTHGKSQSDVAITYETAGEIGEVDMTPLAIAAKKEKKVASVHLGFKHKLGSALRKHKGPSS